MHKGKVYVTHNAGGRVSWYKLSEEWFANVHANLKNIYTFCDPWIPIKIYPKKIIKQCA